MGLSTNYTVCTDYLKVWKIPPWESIFYQVKKVKYGKFFKYKFTFDIMKHYQSKMRSLF